MNPAWINRQGSLKYEAMKTNSSTEDMKTLSTSVNKLVENGFRENFKVNEKGLFSEQRDASYAPEEVHVVDFFRFEGDSDPADNSILYAIETDDGTKGTLIDAYGSYADPLIGKFMKKVEDISKKPTTADSKV
jgi:hypothetical protein